MQKTNFLQTLGLNEYEEKIYVLLVENGASIISQIVRKTGLHRPTVYKCLPSLISKGLIFETIRGKQKIYNAESPEKLNSLLEQTNLNLRELISELNSCYQSTEKKPLIKFLTKRKGLQTVFADLVNSCHKNEVFYRYSSALDIKKNENYLPKNYRQIRDKKNLERFVITNSNNKQQKKTRLERGIKVIEKPTLLFKHNVTQLIYHGKVAYIDYNSETAIVIENQFIYEFSKNIFMTLYNLL